MADFSAALARTLRWEGGDSDHASDRGGRTRYGISQRAYPGEDIAALTRERAADLYRRNYWTLIRGDDIRHQATAEALFDFAVNSGVSRAVRTVQGLVGVSPDGKVGPVTLAAINGRPNHGDLPALIGAARLRHCVAIIERDRSQRDFLFGWCRRIADMSRTGA